MPSFNLPAPGGSIPAYLALPSGAAAAPGILLLHDLGGPAVDLEERANRFAESGFVALSVGPGQLGGRHRCLRELARDLINGHGPAFASLHACCAWLAAQPRCNGQIGLSGFCATAGFVILLVSEGGASIYASGASDQLPTAIENFLANECPIIDSTGVRDALNQGVAHQLERNLEKALATLNTQNLSSAELMFMNDLRVFWFKLLRLPASGADPAATDEFHRSLIDFFSSHLVSA